MLSQVTSRTGDYQQKRKIILSRINSMNLTREDRRALQDFSISYIKNGGNQHEQAIYTAVMNQDLLYEAPMADLLSVIKLGESAKYQVIIKIIIKRIENRSLNPQEVELLREFAKKYLADGGNSLEEAVYYALDEEGLLVAVETGEDALMGLEELTLLPSNSYDPDAMSSAPEENYSGLDMASLLELIDHDSGAMIPKREIISRIERGNLSAEEKQALQRFARYHFMDGGNFIEEEVYAAIINNGLLQEVAVDELLYLMSLGEGRKHRQLMEIILNKIRTDQLIDDDRQVLLQFTNKYNDRGGNSLEAEVYDVAVRKLLRLEFFAEKYERGDLTEWLMDDLLELMSLGVEDKHRQMQNAVLTKIRGGNLGQDDVAALKDFAAHYFAEGGNELEQEVYDLLVDFGLFDDMSIERLLGLMQLGTDEKHQLVRDILIKKINNGNGITEEDREVSRRFTSRYFNEGGNEFESPVYDAMVGHGLVTMVNLLKLMRRGNDSDRQQIKTVIISNIENNNVTGGDIMVLDEFAEQFRESSGNELEQAVYDAVVSNDLLIE